MQQRAINQQSTYLGALYPRPELSRLRSRGVFLCNLLIVVMEAMLVDSYSSKTKTVNKTLRVVKFGYVNVEIDFMSFMLHLSYGTLRISASINRM